MKTFFDVLIGFSFIALFAIPLIYGLYLLIKNIYRYKFVAPKQRKMFNQLVKGDFLWRVGENGVTYFTVDKVKYNLNRKEDTIRGLKIYYSDYDYIEMTPEAAKTFKFNNWHTIKTAAEVEANALKCKRNEAILGVMECTPEDVKKASDNLIKQLESIK